MITLEEYLRTNELEPGVKFELVCLRNYKDRAVDHKVGDLYSFIIGDGTPFEKPSATSYDGWGNEFTKCYGVLNVVTLTEDYTRYSYTHEQA